MDLLAEPLLFHRRYTLARQLTIGALPGARLFTQRFSADLVLADCADTTFQGRAGLGAYHASFDCLSHTVHLPSGNSAGLIHDSYLLGMFNNHFQAVLRVIFDKTGQFHVAIFKILGGLFVFL